MAQKRMLDRKISVSDQVNYLSIEAQLLFTWGIPHADDFGFLPHNPNTLKAIIFPMKDIKIEDFNRWVKEIIDQELWEIFDYKGKLYYKIAKFSNYQTLKKDRQPNSFFTNIRVDKEPKRTWDKIEAEIESHTGSNTVPKRFQSGTSLETEVKRSEEKGREYLQPADGLRILPENKNSRDTNSQELVEPTESPGNPEKILDSINQLFDVFYNSINPNINYGNKTMRKWAKKLIDDMGLDNAIEAAQIAVSVQGQQFAPVITDPAQLYLKMSALMIYCKKQSNQEQNKKGVIIA